MTLPGWKGSRAADRSEALLTAVLLTRGDDVALGQAGGGAGRAGEGAVDHRAHRGRSRWNPAGTSPSRCSTSPATWTPRKAVAPMWIVELARPSSMLLAIDSAVPIGMA